MSQFNVHGVTIRMPDAEAGARDALLHLDGVDYSVAADPGMSFDAFRLRLEDVASDLRQLVDGVEVAERAVEQAGREKAQAALRAERQVRQAEAGARFARAELDEQIAAWKAGRALAGTVAADGS